jgi:hypothetical protein
VPDNYNYVVEVVIWKGDTIIKTGEGYVQLNPERTINKDQQVEKKQIRTEDFVTEVPTEEGWNEEASEESPGFGIITGLIATMFALFLIRRGKND